MKTYGSRVAYLHQPNAGPNTAQLLPVHRGPPIGLTRGFLRYLQQAWELSSIAQIPRAVLARAVPRLTGRRRGDH